MTFDYSQQRVLNSPPNLIVYGCPGSGKTVLAFTLANKLGQENPEKTILVLVLTKALRAYITANIVPVDAPNVTVLHNEEWRRQGCLAYDYIIVDEVVDFSKEEVLNLIKPKANIGIYLFGDDNQQLYEENLYGEKTITIKELIKETGYPQIGLSKNYRVSREIIAFLEALLGKMPIPKERTSGIKAAVRNFETQEEEITWLIDYVKEHKDEDIGILLPVNQDKIISIYDLWRQFSEQNVPIGYKQKFDDHLSFSNPKNANILTIHSSKGLEFDTVILPFRNEDTIAIFEKNLLYVALTRARHRLILTYAPFISSEWFNLELNPAVFEGELREEPRKAERRRLLLQITEGLQKINELYNKR